jgi:hypothetical protein
VSAAIDLLRRESASLVQRLRLWTPQRWAAQHGAHGTRAGLAFHLAQALADTAADLEGEPQRPLPRLGSDLALPDQVAVTCDDLVRAGPPDGLARDATAHLLLHRHDLLGDAVPEGLAAALGVDDVLGLGRAVCEAAVEPPTAEDPQHCGAGDPLQTGRGAS